MNRPENSPLNPRKWLFSYYDIIYADNLERLKKDYFILFIYTVIIIIATFNIHWMSGNLGTRIVWHKGGTVVWHTQWGPVVEAMRCFCGIYSCSREPWVQNHGVSLSGAQHCSWQTPSERCFSSLYEVSVSFKPILIELNADCIHSLFLGNGASYLEETGSIYCSVGKITVVIRKRR